MSEVHLEDDARENRITLGVSLSSLASTIRDYADKKEGVYGGGFLEV